MQKMQNICKMLYKNGSGSLFSIIIFSLSVVGCNNSGDHMADRDINSAQEIHTGIFVDSPVKGLYYSTDTQSGVTDENGTFTYMDGEKVSFHLGDMELGEATGEPILTPVDLVVGAEDETNQTVTNICRLLQTLDYDADPENGITITEEISDAVATENLDFMMGEDDFENQDEMIDIMENLMDVEGFEHGRMMVSGEQAQMHMRGTMMGMGMMNSENGSGSHMMDDGGMMSDDHMGNGGSMMDRDDMVDEEDMGNNGDTMMDDDTMTNEDMYNDDNMMDNDGDSHDQEIEKDDDNDHLDTEEGTNVDHNNGTSMGGMM